MDTVDAFLIYNAILVRSFHPFSTFPEEETNQQGFSVLKPIFFQRTRERRSELEAYGRFQYCKDPAKLLCKG